MRGKKCPKCNKVCSLELFSKDSNTNDGLKCWCKICDNKHKREYHRKNKCKIYKVKKIWRNTVNGKKYLIRNSANMRKKYPEKYLARLIVRNALRNGLLIKDKCSVCGEEKIHAHHNDYNKPLDIRWFCPKHHYLEHRKERICVAQ